MRNYSLLYLLSLLTFNSFCQESISCITKTNSTEVCGKIVNISNDTIQLKDQKSKQSYFLRANEISKISTSDVAALRFLKVKVFEKIPMIIDSSNYKATLAKNKALKNQKSIVRIYRNYAFVGAAVAHKLSIGTLPLVEIFNGDAVEIEFFSEGETCISFRQGSEVIFKMPLILKPNTTQYYRLLFEFGSIELRHVGPIEGKKEFEEIASDKKYYEKDMGMICHCLKRKDSKVITNDTIYLNNDEISTKKNADAYLVNLDINQLTLTYTQRTYSINGQLKNENERSILKSDYYQGFSKEYYPSGQIKWAGNFEYGNLIGEFKSYYPNGKLKESGTASPGFQNHIISYLDLNGNNFIFKGNGHIHYFDSTKKETIHKIVKDSVVKAVFNVRAIDTIYTRLEDSRGSDIRHRVIPLIGEKKADKIFEKLKITRSQADLNGFKKEDFAFFYIEFIIDKNGAIEDILCERCKTNTLKEKIREQLIKIGGFNALTLEDGTKVKCGLTYRLYTKIISD